MPQLTRRHNGAFAFAVPHHQPSTSDVAVWISRDSTTIANELTAGDDGLVGHRELAESVGYRSVVAVPMLKEGQPLGVIVLGGRRVGSFPRRQIELLKTFRG